MDQYTSWIISLSPNDSPETIRWKAANITPHPRQLAWQQLELTAFIHFGVNTFTNREWGTGMEDPSVFNPSELNCRQWVRVLEEAGFKQVTLTAKHHDGFCLWPSRFTSFSVASCGWKDGKGDVVRELTEAAHEVGLKVGLYLSPADLHEIEAPGGRYGNNSPAVESTIGSNPSYTCVVDDYNRYFLNQLYELLTQYGPIHEVWFDGANPKPGTSQKYSETDWFKLVRLLAPDAVMFNGPDLRWVGNEDGYARQTEWSPLPFRAESSEIDPETSPRILDVQAENLGDLDKLINATRLGLSSDTSNDLLYLAWSPAETDVTIRPGWFYHPEEDKRLKSLDQLKDIYLSSVGRNSLLLLNIPPDRRGLFADPDVQRIHEFGNIIKRIHSTDLASFATHRELPWSPDAEQGELILEFPKPVTFNFLMLQEDLAVGQRVEAFSLDCWLQDHWEQVVSGTTIGYKRLLTFSPVEADRLRLSILQSRLPPKISSVRFFLFD